MRHGLHVAVATRDQILGTNYKKEQGMTSSNDTRITVSRRSVAQVAPYESEEASTSVEFTMSADSSPEEILDAAQEWRNSLARANFEALGVGYEEIDAVVRRLQKSVPGDNQSVAMAAPPPSAPPTAAADSTGNLWRDLMNNSGNWFTNWPDQLEGKDNPTRPAYRRRGDGKGLWLTRKDANSSPAFPSWFVCPQTGKTGDALAEVGRQIRQRLEQG